MVMNGSQMSKSVKTLECKFMNKLRVNPIALKDLLNIRKYITEELDNPIAALRIIEKIVESYELLKEFPMMGGALSSKIDISTDYRFLICDYYIVFYKVESGYVSIYRILYAKRDYLRILFKAEIPESE